MSSTESEIPGQRQGTMIKTNTGILLSLNDLFKESLKRMQARYKHPDIIVRCESLPQISGDHGEITKLFDHLLGIIFTSAPNGSRFFLHVDCVEERPGNVQQPGFKQYAISFHTNITTTEEWKKEKKQMLAQCLYILSTHNAEFVVNNINHTGCLFSITVPGKFQ